MSERPDEVKEIQKDSMLKIFFEEGVNAYCEWEDRKEIEIKIQSQGGHDYKVYVKARDREEFAEEATEQLKDLKGYIPKSTKFDYSSEERLNAFIRGFGYEAANRGDLRTAISAIDTILDSDDRVKQDLGGSLMQILNPENYIPGL